MSGADTEFPVVFAGGGLVGLSTAMFLAQHGIPSLAVERLHRGSQLPRAAFFHMRTLELFRSAGIEDVVRARSLEEFEPEGSISLMDTLAGKVLVGFVPSLNQGVDAFSPCRRLFITQPGLEPILRQRAEGTGAKVLNGHEVTGIAQDADGVATTIRNVDTGEERTVRSQYLVGADGAHSKVRELAGIEFDGRGVFSNSITIYFEAPLAPLLVGKNISVIYIGNPHLGGFFRLDKDQNSGFLVVNTAGDTSKPEASSPANDVREETLVAHVRNAAGVPDLPVKITGTARWRATSDVARRFRDRRVFLAGDSAHLMPPNGGYGGNTGIHDGHNLGWKLALALKGLAGPRLLETYEAERRPAAAFTVEQAYTRVRDADGTVSRQEGLSAARRRLRHRAGISLSVAGNRAGARRRGRRRSDTRASKPVARPAWFARTAPVGAAAWTANLHARSVSRSVRAARRPGGDLLVRCGAGRGGAIRRPSRRGASNRGRWLRRGVRHFVVRRDAGAPRWLRRLAVEIIQPDPGAELTRVINRILAR